MKRKSHIEGFLEHTEKLNISGGNMEEYTFLEVNFRNTEGDDRWTIVKVPMNWDESEIRNSMMNDREISEIYNMFETGCSDGNYSWDFT